MDVPRVDYEKLASDRAGESSEAVRQRVLSARERQLARFDGSDLACNADTPALPQKTGTSCTAGGCVRCKCGPGAHPRILRVGRYQQSLDAQRDESTRHERAGISSGIEVGAHDRGFGGGGADSSGSSGRGDPVSTEKAGVICRQNALFLFNATLQVSSRCNGCNICVSICPLGAMIPEQKKLKPVESGIIPDGM
jgi:ferredoxin